MKYDAIIIGAGPSGLMCAIEAAKRGCKTIVVDHNDAVGKKLLICGGGSPNFSNLNVTFKDYKSENVHFPKSALARFVPEDVISLLKEHRIDYVKRTGGRLFLKGSGRLLVKMLADECDKLGVEFLFSANVENFTKDALFKIKTDRGVFQSGSLVVATGGLSYKNLGASDLGYRIAKKFGHDVIAPYPALTPLLWGKGVCSKFMKLSGISIKAEVGCRGFTIYDDMLFTHEGLSGPAILSLSLHLKDGESFVIDTLPRIDIKGILFDLKRKAGSRLIVSILSNYLPKRFAIAWIDAYFSNRPLNELSDKVLNKISEALHRWEVTPAARAGYDKAEVTAGGVSTDDISSKTFESKKVKGLYFVGEVLDVTGALGGYNLHWAFASGFSAGQFIFQFPSPLMGEGVKPRGGHAPLRGQGEGVSILSSAGIDSPMTLVKQPLTDAINAAPFPCMA